MATVPLSGTNIRFLSGVPFSNDYKNTRWFDDKTSQTNYFLNKNVVHRMDNANFQRIDGYHFIAVNKSIDELWGTNYVMFQNSSYNSKWFYGFVTKLEYKQKNTTYVHFQIDVFQTWKFEMNFKPSFVIREHCKLWNSDGSPVINTVDEGLNYGTEYETVGVDNYRPYDDILFLVIVSKTQLHNDLNKIKPIINGVPQPLSYYIHPFKLNGDAVTVDGVTLAPIQETLETIMSDENAVNNIVSLYVTEFSGMVFGRLADSDTLVTIGDHFDMQAIGTTQVLYVTNLETYSEMTKNMGSKYNGYNLVEESKLLMYPYTVTILDDFKGNRTVIKNEYINDSELKIRVKGSMGTSNKVTYALDNYLADNGLNGYDMTQVSLEHAIINNSSNDIPIITDLLSAYLQGNRNSLENQKNSIMWNGFTNAIGNTVGGVASGMQGNASGVASAGVGVIQGAGNTVLQLQSIESKKQDINNIPPQLVKMGSNTNFDFGNDYMGLYIIKKQITNEYRNKLTDFFKMFGYKVNEVKIPNFHTRQNWNYVETSSCNITGNFNNEDLNELKSVFDNGITLWHTDDVGNYTLENGVI